jgi:hypothetical protein
MWRVKIINYGWITDLKIKDNDTNCETPVIPLAVEANSLYECNNTYQLINFYHATLNYPVISTLVKAINKGYLKVLPASLLAKFDSTSRSTMN